MFYFVSYQHLKYFRYILRGITNIMQDVNNIIDYLIVVKVRKLHYGITPTNQIIVNLKEAALVLHFPFRIRKSNWLETEKCIAVSIHYDESNIYTILKFPLISHPKYDILKIISLPVYNYNNIFTITEVDQTISLR
ncbi:hypothetical protein ALC56_03961 [Trachymyrmex septentrionalis]|uniref:Uncharacterized protein n=1 Tax=Trachymyrmex septentrionalis TaxID=34720 RepID=A0A151JZ09_9HYME|nr:hypothetical protein ALC56_03961 [Trachymyrmex septentrionalis]